MGKLKILALGETVQAKNQAKGKLFEDLMAKVLDNYGFSIDRKSSTNYSGMEIDIEGKAIIAGTPLYAECKYYESEVKSPQLHAFFGKYMGLHYENRQCQGLFIAIPGINSHAKGFYRDYCENKPEFVVRLIEEDGVLEAIYKSSMAVRPEVIAQSILEPVGMPGDSNLLYTKEGIFWVQYVIEPEAGIASAVTFFNAEGKCIQDPATIELLSQLDPELKDFRPIQIDKNSISHPIVAHSNDQSEPIVEVLGSSEYFEYQFPAAPEYFVGRQDVLKDIDDLAKSIILKETSSRGVLLEANSGWGKSSVVLSSVARLREQGHFAIAIDSRSASSSQFILRVVEYALNKFSKFDSIENLTPTSAITGFDGAIDALLSVNTELEKKEKLLVIFLDQFENVFFLPEALKRIKDTLLKICDSGANILFGFSWKTDLVGLMSEFPYQDRDAIKNSSKQVVLKPFSEPETSALLSELSKELRVRLRKDLSFFLSEFSQGYPWLLKKLCAHVKTQRASGITQEGIAMSLLNVEELFKADLHGLDAHEDDALRRIAAAAPVSIGELEDFRPEILQSLINRRLIVQVANKYDIYWDIFRDYLTGKRIPIQENYILRVNVGSALKAVKLLAESMGSLQVEDFRQKMSLSEGSFYNLSRDMKLLGMATIEGNCISLRLEVPQGKKIDSCVSEYLQERLLRNRLMSMIMGALETEITLFVDEVASILAESCPYVSAVQKTWDLYARRFCDWLDFSNLAIYDGRNNTLERYSPGTAVREREIRLSKRRAGMAMPQIQYKPVEQAAIRIVEAAQQERKVDWSNFRRSTITKSMAALEDIGFIKYNRKTGTISVSDVVKEFVAKPDKRSELFALGAKQLPSFVTFIDLLEKYNHRPRPSVLAIDFRDALKLEWTPETAETNAKIMLNWARYTNLVPKRFSRRKSESLTLFDMENE
jgi:hypothetical protein